MAVQAESAPHDTAVSQRQPIETLSTGGSEVLTALSAVLCLDCKRLPVCLQSSCQCAGQMRRGTLAWWCCHQSSPAAAGRLPALSSCCMSCWSTRSLLQTGGPPQLDLAMPLTTCRPLAGSCHEKSPYVFSRSLLAGLCTCHRPEQCHCLPARSLPGLQEQAQSVVEHQSCSPAGRQLGVCFSWRQHACQCSMCWGCLEDAAAPLSTRPGMVSGWQAHLGWRSTWRLQRPRVQWLAGSSRLLR